VTIVVSSVVGAVALIALICLYQFIRYAPDFSRPTYIVPCNVVESVLYGVGVLYVQISVTPTEWLNIFYDRPATMLLLRLLCFAVDVSIFFLSFSFFLLFAA